MDLPDAVLFDFGDTLVAPGRHHLEAAAEAVLARARDRNGVTAEAALREGDRLVPIADVRRRTEESELEFPAAWFLRLLHESLGVEFDLSLLEREQIYFRALYPESRLVPGVPELLDALRVRGIPTAVVSNASFRGVTLEGELARLGIRDRVGFLMSSADYGFRKPHPAMLRVALARLGVRPERALYCGDRPERDVAAARAAGMVSVLLAPEGAEDAEPAPDLVVRHWDELTERLRGGSPGIR